MNLKRNILIICAGCLFNMFLLFHVIYNNRLEEKNILKEDNKNINYINNNQFGMYLKNEDGEYIEYNNGSDFPPNSTFNSEKSYCIDNKQNVINNVIRYNNGNILLDVKKTTYCYLYFDMILDTEPPTNNSVLINNDEPTTTSTSVNLTLSSIGATEMCISNTESCDSWITYATSKSWTLTSGDGTKTVYVWYKDENGNATTTYVSDSIILDTTAPTDNSVKINNNATYTTSTNVTLALSSIGATEMCISNSTSCSSWITYATSKSWTLTSGDGTKTVYVWYKDASGIQTTTYVSDSIILDTTAPTVTASAVSNNTTSPKVTFSSNEAGTYCVNTNSTRTNMNNCVASGNISANSSLTTGSLSSKTYYVHVKDAAGNIGISNGVTLTKLQSFGEYLINAETLGFNISLVGGLNRYEGTTAYNYVCFGTTSKSTCTSDTDRYMYRVIGVDSSKQVKIIKKEALNSSIVWYINSSYDYGWPQSTIYSKINGSSFYTNTTYVPTSWQSKIASVDWKYGDVSKSDTDYAPNDVYGTENAWTDTVNAKIGLIYLHDYAYVSWKDCNGSSTTECKNSWIHLSNNDSAPPANYEWTIAHNQIRDGSITYGSYSAQCIDYTTGRFDSKNIDNSLSVRPVFFLTSSVNYVSGSGTESDPFIIS